MSLKQHNDIVQKLLKQLDSKQSQIAQLKKQLHKSPVPSSSGNAVVAALQKQHTKKITLLHKDYKQKLSAQNQQILTLTMENKDVKQRMQLMKNMEDKQKQQTMEIMKKIGNITQHQPKVAAVVSHMQTEIQRKQKYIRQLQKQIKDNHYQQNQNKKNKTKPYQVQQQQQQQQQQRQNTQPVVNMPKPVNSQHYHTKYQQEIQALRQENTKLQRILEEKNKQFKDITRRYAQLTKEYYRIMNQYQVAGTDKVLAQATVLNNSSTNMKKDKSNGNNNIIGGVLQQMVDKFNQQSNSECGQSKSQASLSYSFLSNYNKMNPEFQPTTTESQSVIQPLLQLFDLQSSVQLLPTLTKLKVQSQHLQVYESIFQYLHSMFYRLGYGKIGLSDMYAQLQKFQQRISKYLEDKQLLQQACIEIGAKKVNLISKIKDFKSVQDQFFSNMKNIDFMAKLPKANKIVQFIQYFQLDKQVCQLPQQLRKMYQQLKYIDKFIKISCTILEKEPQGLERTLEAILRYLERKQAEQTMKLGQTNKTTKDRKKEIKNVQK